MAFLRNTWYVAGHDYEIAEAPLGRMYLGEPVNAFTRHWVIRPLQRADIWQNVLKLNKLALNKTS